MKIVFLQITERMLKVTPVKKSGKQTVFGTPFVFELPESLTGGKAFTNIHGLSVFTANCIRGSELAKRPFIFCLDNRFVITKEYRHLPARESDLKKLAKLEAETVLQDGAENYVIATQEYHHTDAASNRLKSILFAVPNSLVIHIKQEFHQAGIKVIRIMPVISGFMTSCKSVLGLIPQNPLYHEKTIAVIDTGYESLRVILFHNGEAIFQRNFDSVWEDILEVLQRENSMSFDDAQREMLRSGFLLTGGSASFGNSLTSTVNTLLETASAEVIRNVRVVLSSERLELDQILFCGAVASHPDFNQLIENLSLEIPFDNIETANSQYSSLVGMESQAAVSGCHIGDFFSLNGLLEKQSSDTIDFMAEENEKRGNLRISIAVMAVLTLLSAGIMAIEPIMNQAAVKQEKADQTFLSSPQVTDIRKLQVQQASLQSEIHALENDKDMLPWQKSKMEEIVIKLNAQLVPQVDRITTCQISGTTGVITLGFTTTTFDKFNKARTSVADAGYFKVLIPFSIVKYIGTQSGSSGNYQCSATLQVKDFKPVSNTASSSKGGS